MANYLERVASSAGRRAALAKPPGSGPPLLPTKDLSLPAEGLLTSEDEQLSEPVSHGGLEKRESSRAERSADVAPTVTGRLLAEAEASKSIDDLTPVPKPPVAHESLSSEPPFTVHLPKTLRPIADTKIQPASEQPVAPSHAPAKAEPTPEETHAPVVQSSSDPVVKEVVKESVTFAVESATTRIADPTDEHRPRTREQIEIVAAPASEPTPVQRVDETPVKIPAPLTSHRSEPLPAAASPVHMPPPLVVGSASRQEQSRISIGSLEVLVNNHPPVAPVPPPASTPSLNEKANLERRYLDRFRLRH